MKPWIAELKPWLGDRLTVDPRVREDHGRDVSYHRLAPPDAVAYPQSTDEVQRLVQVCSRHRTPLVPFGAGTSLEGQVLAPLGGLSIDLSRMNRIVAVHAADQDAVVQPGVTRQQLDAALAADGLFFAVDPGTEATLGGMASTRASGTRTVRYGTMRDAVLALQLVLADGRIVRTGGRARKSAAGYDLTRLFVGAEGTLGVITELTLRLHPLPEAISSAVCPFRSLDDAVDAVTRIVRALQGVARIELLDAAMIDAVNRHSGLEHEVAPTLFFEFHGSSAGVAEQAERARAIAGEYPGASLRWATDDGQRRRLWRARHDAYHAARALRPRASGFTTDVCVPLSQLPRCVAQTRDDLRELAIPVLLVGHVGDGNFHLIFLVDPDSSSEMQQVQALNRRLVRRALDMGGTCSGEHGIGLGKREFLAAEHGDAVEVMRAIKRALDPTNLMNPTKMLPAPDDP